MAKSVDTVGAGKRKRISVVVPAFNEASNLPAFYQAVTPVIDEMSDYEWHFIFVDDGSSDPTWQVIKDLASKDPRVSGISLSRNFGKEIALTAGAEASIEADAAIFMDADLQHPPNIITALVDQWKRGFQVVVTCRTSIEYSRFRELGSRFFYFLLGKLTDLDIRVKTTDFQLLDSEVLRVLKTFKERTRFFRGLTDWVGFKKTFVTFTAPSRTAGASTFRFKDLTRLAVNSLTTFSLVPLKLTGYLGMLVLFGSVFVLLYMVISQLFMGQLFTPLAYFVVINTFLVGIVLAALGLIALYIGHIHTEVVGRPLYIVQERVGIKHEPVARILDYYTVQDLV